MEAGGQTTFEPRLRSPMSQPQFLSKTIKSFKNATGPATFSLEGNRRCPGLSIWEVQRSTEHRPGWPALK